MLWAWLEAHLHLILLVHFNKYLLSINHIPGTVLGSEKSRHDALELSAQWDLEFWEWNNGRSNILHEVINHATLFTNKCKYCFLLKEEPGIMLSPKQDRVWFEYTKLPLPALRHLPEPSITYPPNKSLWKCKGHTQLSGGHFLKTWVWFTEYTKKPDRVGWLSNSSTFTARMGGGNRKFGQKMVDQLVWRLLHSNCNKRAPASKQGGRWEPAPLKLSFNLYTQVRAWAHSHHTHNCTQNQMFNSSVKGLRQRIRIYPRVRP